MAAKTKKRKPGSAEKTVTLPEGVRGVRDVTGSESEDFGHVLLNQTFNCLWSPEGTDKTARDKQISSTLVAMMGIAPRDEIEGMLAAQMVAVHNAAMECLRRAMISGQSFEGRDQNLKHAAKFTRTFTAQMEALNRYRGKGQQKMTVEHVHVHQGGQAIVGPVSTTKAQGGGENEKTAEQPQAIAYAPEPALRSPDADGDALSVSGDGKRPVPAARR